MALTIDQQKAIAMANARKRAAESKDTTKTSPSMFTGDIATLRNIGEEKPDYYYAQTPLIPVKENLKTGEKSLAVPEPFRTIARGTADILQSGVTKSTETTPDAVQAMGIILPSAKPILEGASGAAEGAASALGRGAREGAGAVKGGISTMKSGYAARDADALDQAIKSMDKLSDQAAANMRKMNIKFPSEITQKLDNNIARAYEEESFGRLDPNLHGETMHVLKDMKEASGKGGYDIQDLDNYRKRLRQIANKGGEDAAAAGVALDALRTSISEYEQALPKGATFLPYVNQYAKARRFETLADIVKKANGDPQKIKLGFQKLLDSKKKMRGFTSEEEAAIKEASQYTTPEKLYRLAGKFGFELGNTKTAASGVFPGMELIYGGAYHNPYMLPLVAGGTGARYGGKLLARGKAERALQAVEGRNAQQAIGSETDELAK